MRVVNFYHNPDFNSIYQNYSENYFFRDSIDLTEKINFLASMNDSDFNILFESINKGLNMHSLSSLNERLNDII